MPWPGPKEMLARDAGEGFDQARIADFLLLRDLFREAPPDLGQRLFVRYPNRSRNSPTIRLNRSVASIGA